MKDLYYVIGFPVKHSLSPKIQMNLAKQYNQNMFFEAMEVAPSDLESKVRELRFNEQVKGLSVTVPHKEKIFDLCDSADKTASKLGAASNVIFTSDRKMVALNYDGLGIINDIKNNYNIGFEGKKVLVVGAGGAAKAVVASVIDEKPASISISNRTRSKVEGVCKLFGKEFPIRIEEFSSILGSFDIVINSTSSSIYGELLPLKLSNFNKNSFAYDLMYADNGTIFTNWCLQNNIQSANGKGMLEELSKAVFKYWRGL